MPIVFGYEIVGFAGMILIGFADSVVFRDAEKHRDKECLAAIAI